MAMKQMLDLRNSILPEPNSNVVPGGMLMASAAIGLAPVIAAVGLLSGAGLFAVAGSCCMLGGGLITAVLSADR
jgi:hypothetical protein